MALSEQNVRSLRDRVAAVGYVLEGKIPATEEVPNPNPYAYLWKAIKTAFGKSYRDLDDGQATVAHLVVNQAATAALKAWESHRAEIASQALAEMGR